MTTFKKLYSSAYDMMYGAKDYSAEADFYRSLLLRYAPSAKDLVSLGAGTLNHERHLVKKSFSILGIDQSEEMVKLAKKKIKKEKLKNLSVVAGDMLNFKASKKFDAALSMFNVLSYCPGIGGLEKTFMSVSKNLKPGGVFIFDCWNKEAVQADPPQSRFAVFENRETRLYRLTTAHMNTPRTAINLEIELVSISGKKLVGREVEKHDVYFWSKEELTRALAKAGMKVVLMSQFMDSTKPPSKEKWAMVVVAKKI